MLHATRALASSFVFFGTSRFAVIVLDELKARGFVPALVVTAPDRPAGRGLKFTSPPVKLWAQDNSIELIQLKKLDEVFVYKLKAKSYELGVLAAYGKIIPRSILAAFPHGILNIHPSLLPKYRGPSPIQTHILADNRKVGVTVMLLDEQMDHGPIVTSYQLPATSYKNVWPPRAKELEEALAHAGGKLLAEILPQWLAGDITPQEQDHARATYTKKITREDGLIAVEDITNEPYETFLKFSAFDQWPGIYFFAKRQDKKIRVKIKNAAFRNGALEVIRVQPEGGREIAYRDFMRGLGLHIG